MGFGHRVYKNYDPRAALVKATAHEVLASLGAHDPLLDLAFELEEVALSDDYFVSRQLYPNVDFYTGLIYKAMGFPTKMFTVLFALGRLPGWIAQWREMINDPATKIGRPRQVYTGHTARTYTPVADRCSMFGCPLVQPATPSCLRRASTPRGRRPRRDAPVTAGTGTATAPRGDAPAAVARAVRRCRVRRRR